MQRLKAFPVAVINLFIRFIHYLLNKLKHLALHILKHPLGTIWWCIKMYFALMLLTLFVACSFGAMAQVYDETDFKLADDTELWCSNNYATICSPFFGKAVDMTIEYYLKGQTVSTGELRLTPSLVSKVLNQPSVTFIYSLERYEYRFNGGTLKYEWTYISNSQTTASLSFTKKTGKACPPRVHPDYNIGPIKVGSEERCYKPKPNSCFESDDFKLANQYHFDPVSQGKGQVCVKNDKAENCPWKELPGSNGVFEPDVDNKSACDLTPPPPLSDPAEKPKDPEKCVPGGNGMMVCKADPNEKCAVNSTGAMSCPDSCGYMNGEFMCFTEPDIPDDPNKPPKKPVPEPDDNITDPLKKMADMNKQDLKEIQRGVESRLEGFSATMENSMNELAAQGKNAEKAAGVGNKLLNSINQNTADTVKELKKLTGDESNPQPNYEETELGEKNDWQVRNFGTVMKAAADKILEKPMFQAIDGYFDVSFGGTCPTWNVSIWVFEVEINQFCDQSFQAVLPLIRSVVILIFSILAFRVAFL